MVWVMVQRVEEMEKERERAVKTREMACMEMPKGMGYSQFHSYAC